MKKLFVIIAALGLAAASASAQTLRAPEFDLSSSDKVDSDLRIAFPMYFGFSAPMDSPSPFPNTKYTQNFYYALEVASIKFHSDTSPFSFSIGLKCTFMDFSFEDTSITYRKVGPALMPYPIIAENLKYDGKKSKVHASYVGAPIRFAFKAGRAKLFIGGGADYMFHGYTKYRSPKYREDLNALFNPFHAYAEAGVTYSMIGLFANYSITPIFADGVSDTRTLTIGFTFGL